MKTQTEWTTLIRPRKGILDLDLREVWRYRDLLALFVRRDFVALYKQTILGPLWFFFQPLFTTVMFTLVFGSIARISTDGLPPILFYMAGTVTWSYFQECLVKTSNTFIVNAPIFGKVYFPRLVVPLSIVITNLIAFLLQFVFFLAFLLYYGATGSRIEPNVYVLMMPVYLLMMAALGLGLGIIVASLTTKYRDLRFLISFGAQLLMYGTPVVYPLSSVPDKWLPFFLANPMTPIIESMRYAFLGVGVFRADHLLMSGGIILIILVTGVLLFTRVERTFMDTV
ncbi:MAG: ABC transporter permease [Ignavibacteriae bacterium]|nr:ABC transporter permease [Ignavibacteriota bacterium]